jgi:hypothetical protein
MAHFNLNWFNTAVIINSNVTGQRASHRQKSIGGAFSASGYTPANDLPKTASSTQSPDLATNKVWEFKVEALCTVGGPTANDNGLVEALKFSCLVPDVTFNKNTSTITLNVAGLDITSATFILHKQSDNSVVEGPTTVARTGTAITHTATGLTPGTGYYWEFIQYAIVNGSQVASNDPSQLNVSCTTSNFTTDEDVCDPITKLSATATEY